MKADRIKEHILANAAEVVRLHSRIHATYRRRDESGRAWEEWSKACAEMRERYDNLAFPGGYNGALERISAGDADAIETAICFLEVRPYFFRSGYMYKVLLRRCGRASLSPDQAARLDAVKSAVAEWKRSKRAKNEPR